MGSAVISASIVINPGALTAIVATSKERLLRVIVAFWTACLKALNKSNPRPYQTPSAPGEPPRLRTANLRNNVTWSVAPDGLSGKVGVTANARYGLYLELGTKRMAARPWLSATLKAELPRLQQIASGGK